MDSRTRERVEDWQAVPCDAGLDGLRDLADGEFTGVVSGAGAWAFVLNGRIVGLSGGTLDDFEGTPLTAYEAPDPALPLLFAMQEEGGETQAKYYTNDTPIAEARETLSDGSFTGFIELSENVLSGDYYVCFYGGRALSVAFIGSSERLLTGDEAFERADDEVGIYEVKAVEIDVVELPDTEAESDAEDAVVAEAGTSEAPDEDETADESSSTTATEASAGDATETTDAESGTVDAATGTSEAETGTSDDEPSTGTDEPGDDAPSSSPDTGTDAAESGAESTARGEPAPATEPERAVEEGPAGPTGDQRTDSADEDEDDSGDARSAGTASRERSEGSGTGRESTESARGESPERESDARGPAERDEPERSEARRNKGRPRETAKPGSPHGTRPDPAAGESRPGGTESSADEEPRFEREAEWRETRRIPSIDPDKSDEADERTTPAGTSGGTSLERSRSKRTTDSRKSVRSDRREAESSRSDARSDREASSRPTPSTRKSRESGSTEAPSRPDGTIEKPLEQDMLEREDEIDRLQQRVSDLETKRETLQGERDTLEREKKSLEEENEQLRNRVEELEDEVEALESQIDELETTLERAEATGDGTATTATRSMSSEQALAATNLFLRYESKGQATLEDVHAGDADADALNANLRLEHHTNFDATDVAVDGEAYDQFLETSIHFEFVDWLLRELPFEIRETGNAKKMDGLYDAIPKIDRVECRGSVEILADDEEEGPIVREFDLVARDRMGNPLIIANLNDSLDAATEDMMVSLQESATAVKEAHDELGAAFMVTTSFFDPGALEVAAEATSGSLLSRDSRKSFVKLSRKRGYHLCLVETRDGKFHVNVPEL